MADALQRRTVLDARLRECARTAGVVAAFAAAIGLPVLVLVLLLVLA
jgi:hypothetical protein